MSGDDLTIQDANGTVRVILGQIASNPDDYGLKVVSSDGSTTIIDGTSDVFKIAASGTQSITKQNSSGGVSVTFPGLGSMSTAPAFLGYIAFSSTNTARYLGQWPDLLEQFVAASPGGATTQGTWGNPDLGTYNSDLSGSTAEIVLWAGEVLNASMTLHGKYYILLEAAM